MYGSKVAKAFSGFSNAYYTLSCRVRVVKTSGMSRKRAGMPAMMINAATDAFEGKGVLVGQVSNIHGIGSSTFAVDLKQAMNL